MYIKNKFCVTAKRPQNIGSFPNAERDVLQSSLKRRADTDDRRDGPSIAHQLPERLAVTTSDSHELH
ncbi:hypothetical protein EVAR_100089_1 [Eumeta japonica]|uniref:Uncharacterized protein n=1 Tax=Eumeta variegata TaxID=151549 RepID=A0A4C1YZ36_EUMVA|nr:hypothetical protein EVAR_100089_1 [Eumeta japonica]